MKSNPLRIITCLSVLIIIFILAFFSPLEHKNIISLAIIWIFLIIFTYIFNSKGPNSLKAFTIIFSFVMLPIFISIYLKAFSTPLEMLAFSAALVICGIGSVIAIVRLEYVEIDF